MAKLSKTSKNRLLTCHQDIQTIVNSLEDAILVIEGKRTPTRQKELFKAGQSKTMNSKHLVDEKNPLSRAIDIAPEPLNWDNIQAFIKLADKFMAKAEELRKAGKITHKIRWGGDWNMNGEWKDEKFRDLVHFELL